MANDTTPGLDWLKVAAKALKWAVGTAAAGISAAACQGARLDDPRVLGQVALTAVLAGLVGSGHNAWKHWGQPRTP